MVYNLINPQIRLASCQAYQLRLFPFNSYSLTSFEKISLRILKLTFSTTMSVFGEQPTSAQDLDKVYVQNNRDKGLMTISFQYSEANKSRQFNLFRKSSEPLTASLERIKLNLRKVKGRPKSKAKVISDAADDVVIDFRHNGQSLDPSQMRNDEAWIDGSILTMNGKPYQVRTDYPQIETMSLTSCPMEGFMIVPSIELKNCFIDDCKFSWFRQISSQQRDEFAQRIQDPNIQLDSDGRSHWLKVSDQITYIPNKDDVNHVLKLVCWPSDGTRIGPPLEYINNQRVQMNILEYPFIKRHEHTKNPTSEPQRFRVVSYNILADIYADQDYSRTVLFRHCPTHALEIDYRRQLLLKEIAGYKADIIGLQEVDRKEFMRTYEPYMRLVENQSGVMSNKGGTVPEGVATFWRNEKFDFVENHATLLAELIQERSIPVQPDTETLEAKVEISPQSSKEEDLTKSAHPLLQDRKTPDSLNLLARFDDIRSCVLANPQLAKRLLERHTIIQTTLLRSKELENQFIIVANTHLYFAPDADHVRLLQGSIFVKYLEFVKEEYYPKILATKFKHENMRLSIVLVGDMNSVPECGLYKLVTEGRVGADLEDWKSNSHEQVVGLSVSTPLRFDSAYQGIPYTNYTPDFKGCLDYIYYEKSGISCESVVPMPDHDDVVVSGGIPSDVFPSDHIALVANLKFYETN